MPLLTPDILVCSVGTEILIRGQADAEWEAYLDEGWDRTAAAKVAARFPELVMQQPSEQRPHKVSYKLYAADAAQASSVISNLRANLAATGLDANVVFSAGEDVDILPSRASKGKALSFLLQQIEKALGQAPPGGVMVCGDSGNDIELFAVPGVYGCMVANAHPELRDWCEANGHDKIFAATEDGPGGIYEALEHFGFRPGSKDVAPADGTSSIARRQAVVELHRWFESYFNDPNAVEGEEGDASVVDAALSQEFELIGPSGVLSSRRELMDWFRQKGRGSRVPLERRQLYGRELSTGSESLLAAAVAMGPAGDAETPSPKIQDSGPPGGGTFRIWVDRYCEKEIVPGSNAWVVRYMELQQRFPPAEGAAASGRTMRWASAVLRAKEGGGYEWVHVHETWVKPAVE